jgi:hypothetical protein
VSITISSVNGDLLDDEEPLDEPELDPPELAVELFELDPQALRTSATARAKTIASAALLPRFEPRNTLSSLTD